MTQTSPIRDGRVLLFLRVLTPLGRLIKIEKSEPEVVQFRTQELAKG
jgi:hypothetical protein